jgi:hypothetical protein
MVHVNSKNGAWGAVFFVSHDPPVIVIQAARLEEFLSQVLDPTRSEPQNAPSHVRKVAVGRAILG